MYVANVDNAPVGIAQFEIKGSYCVVNDFASVPEKYDFEAMFIMGRGTMNFIDLCDVHIAECARDAGDARLLTAIGFKDVGAEHLFVDMEGMFTGGACTSHKQ